MDDRVRGRTEGWAEQHGRPQRPLAGEQDDRAKAAAQHWLDTAPRCVVCGSQMAYRGSDRHFLCEPRSIVGRPCTCPPGCTTTRVGDGDRPCDPECHPCRINRGTIPDRPKGKTR